LQLINLATLLFVPGSLLTVKGGCLFGIVWGSVYVLIAATLGAIWAFLLGRYLSRDWVCRKLAKNPQFQAIDRAVAQEESKIVLLTRLSPVFPFNLLNYAFGVTQVSDLATLDMSNLPTTATTQILQWAIRIMGLMATIAVTIYITRLAKKALAQNIQDGEIINASIKNH
jgi:uncharacterized membrane protein YdjX (TVP38/TMEM64 family)